MTGAPQVPGIGACGLGEGRTKICPFPSTMTARNAFFGPGNWNIDFAAVKTIPVKESVNLQLRGEFFNFLNHSNMYADGTSSAAFASSAAFNVTGYRKDNRTIQVGLRLQF
jgi:hypothetical protein